MFRRLRVNATCQLMLLVYSRSSIDGCTEILQLCLTAAASTISQYVGVGSLLDCGGRGLLSIVGNGLVSY